MRAARFRSLIFDGRSSKDGEEGEEDEDDEGYEEDESGEEEDVSGSLSSGGWITETIYVRRGTGRTRPRIDCASIRQCMS